MSLVWSAEGYPAHGAYRDYHRLTTHHHNPWSNAGDPYDHEAALARARADASDLRRAYRERLRAAAAQADGQLPGAAWSCARIDTELLGHWWYEGVACSRRCSRSARAQGLELAVLDEALARCAPWELGGRTGARPPEPSRSAHGIGAHQLGRGRRPLDVVGAGGRRARLRGGVRRSLRWCTRARARARRPVRELLARQASDWAFPDHERARLQLRARALRGTPRPASRAPSRASRATSATLP